MKIKHSLTAGMSLFALVAALSADEPIKLNVPGQAPAAGSPSMQAAPASAFTQEQLVEEFGWWVAKRVGVTDLQFTPAEVDALMKGFSAAVSAKPAPYDLQKIGPEMDAFMQKKQAAYLLKVKQQNIEQATDFFTKLKQNKNVVELSSGLRYEIVKPGEGPNPKPTETVKVNYTGTLIDGTVFDSSVTRGQPVEFQLDQVIPGWTEGIQKINKGGKIKLYIPPSLAYGDEGRPGIPPGSTLIFDVELLDIKPAAAAPAAPAAAPAPPAPGG